MKLYYHPVSTTSRMVVLFASEANIALDMQVVDLMTGEHMQDAYAKINPSRQVPVLEDDGFILTESSAILKYLADKTNSPAYPKDLKARARVNEVMDWVNTGLYREFGYNLIYPQLFPTHKRPSDATHAGTLEWGRDKAKNWLGILDKSIIGANPYVAGSSITIADYFTAPIISMADLIRCDLTPYPNVSRWMKTMQGLKSWPKVNEVFNGLAASLKQMQFVTM